MDVARTSMIHAAAPHFLWPFAVQYSAHQINLQPRVSLPETTPTPRWTGKVGDASVFRVCGSRAFVRDTSADKLSSRAGPAPSGVSQGDPAEPVEVAVDSGAARGAEPAGAGTGGAEPGGADSGGAASWGAEPVCAESGGSPAAGPGGVRTGGTGAAAAGAAGGAAGAGAARGAAGARATGGAAGAGATGGAAGAGAAGGAAGAGAAGGAAGTGAAGGAAGAGATGGAAGAGATSGAAGAGAAGGAAGAGAPGGAAGAGAAGAAGGGTGAVSAVSGGAARPRPYYVLLLQQSQSPLPPSSLLPGPSPYSGPTRGLTERREPESRPVSLVSRAALPVRTARAGRVLRPRPPPVPGTHTMTLRCSTAPQRVPLPSPHASSLPDGPDPESDSLRAANPTVTRFLATAITDPLPGCTRHPDPALLRRGDRGSLLLSVAGSHGRRDGYLGLRITRDRAQRTITLTQSHVVQQVLQRFGFTYSSPQSTPLATCHSLSAPPSDESVEPSGPYPELVGCLMYLMTCTRPDLAYPFSLLARYVAPGRHRKVHWDAAKRVLRYLCSTSGMGLVLGGRARVVLTGHADASWVDDLATQRSSRGYTFSLGPGSVSWRSTRSSSVLSSSCEAEIYAGAMAAQELRRLTYLLTDLGEAPRSPPVLYVDNTTMLVLCQEHRLEHRTKHIALRYFLARELQHRGQLRLAYVASQANTADVFTKALQPCTRAGGAGAGGVGAGGAGAGGAGDGDPGAGGAGAGGARAGGPGAGGTVQRRPFFVPPQPSSLPPPDSVLRQPDSPMPAPSPYAEQTDSLTERREPESRPSSPVRAVRTGFRIPRPRPPPVPGTHVMALRPSSVPLRVPLPPPPVSSLPAVPES
ncbi:unnamed protein product [Closterium sp. NIES-54]